MSEDIDRSVLILETALVVIVEVIGGSITCMVEAHVSDTFAQTCTKCEYVEKRYCRVHHPSDPLD